MRVLLANHRPGAWKEIRQLIEQQDGVEIIGEVADFSAMVRKIEKGCVDILLLNWDLPGMPPQVIVEFFESTCPQARVIVIADRPEIEDEAMRAGVGVFLDGRDPLNIFEAALLACLDAEVAAI